MSGETNAYPRPQGDADNRPLLEGWRGARLMLQTCAGCERTFFYPRPVCPHCWSAALSWNAATGRGTIVSYSFVHRPNDPAFFSEVPIILAEIRLEEGPALIARIVGCEPAAMRSGLPVALLPAPEALRYPLPTFRLLQS